MLAMLEMLLVTPCDAPVPALTRFLLADEHCMLDASDFMVTDGAERAIGVDREFLSRVITDWTCWLELSALPC